MIMMRNFLIIKFSAWIVIIIMYVLVHKFIATTSAMEDCSTLEEGYYGSTCPSAEDIVKNAVERAVCENPGLAAGLIRMHFHDCFVRGCDASVLLDSTPGSPSEKESPVNNPSLRGFEVIDDAKAQIEAQCPQTVSCADILAFAARDCVTALGGPDYCVPAGRRDGTVSLKHEPLQHLPSPFSNATQLRDSFALKGLTLAEMVTLSGAHSVGSTHCSSFSTRLYSFNSSHPLDPSMNPGFAREMKEKCPVGSERGNDAPLVVPLEGVTPNRLDNNYYVGLKKGRGVLSSDQSLMSSYVTAKMVRNRARDGDGWGKKFAEAMVKMGSIDVLTGNSGEIRKNCRFVN
ncbi:peroxidase 5 [Cannabis sativa]|uniref:peroxidase 5 n=1 Tax=Cannabis sativa TaxID=3483 RepID=UPI0029CA61E4|nr:peroxidase 5 [Cannabis sativa]